jgi:hypothetical protein
MVVPGRVSAERYRLPMDVDTAGHPSQGPDPLTEIGGFGELLRSLEVGGTEAETLARITALEELKATIASAQAREAVAFERLRVERDRRNRVPARDCGVRAGDEVGLAKRVSPGSGRKFLSRARTVVTGLPNTFKALATGSISEDKARIMVEETAVLGDADRRRVDSRMKRSLGPAGLRSLRTEARALSAEMDAEAAAKRAAKAASNRRVSLTPLEDGMGRISAILPLPQAVAAFESLRRAAEATVAGGAANGRSRAQVLADTVVERLSGQPSASAVPAEVHLVVEAESLLSDGLVPAWLPGFGPLPAQTAREFVTANEARVLISRLFTRPEDGQLVGMEARGREFTGRLRQMLVFRDDVCRTPWCDAPIRHADHAEPHAGGGPTEWNNGSGLCAACNFAKEHPGWAHEATAEGLKVTTPSGRTYTVTTPALVRRMRYPHPECGPDAAESMTAAEDWRMMFSRLLEPERCDSSTSEPPPFETTAADPPVELSERLPPRHCSRGPRDRRSADRRRRSGRPRPPFVGAPVEQQLALMIFGPD